MKRAASCVVCAHHRRASFFFGRGLTHARPTIFENLRMPRHAYLWAEKRTQNAAAVHITSSASHRMHQCLFTVLNQD